ncbi:nuclear transport factor 2 family protein [Nocardioides sp. AE5]|uniref:nuclear transport factor 2 family protein n=1 Tax=Nocardioides sp. AE5 TaxID=2962573 RepID=UPI002880E8B3|nr:nuclear transport factor 2 family protein [Nocardioides sp. AE5]MDT0203003.1 nuclear transport factor 2 family protein [Nocardioides sp. AE5]
MTWTRAELEQAFSDYQARVVTATETGDWSHFAASFTEDATYVEHAYGNFAGREQIAAWAQKTMTSFPATEMTAFPPTWSTIDTERGWVICEIANPMRDPGDGIVIAPANVTILRYGGEGLWREEEDVYNPMNFMADVTRWLRIAAAHDRLTDEARAWAAKFHIDL